MGKVCAICTIDKKGLAAYLRDEGLRLSDIVSIPVRQEPAAGRLAATARSCGTPPSRFPAARADLLPGERRRLQ